MVIKYEIRTFVILITTLVLLTLMITSYVELYINDICRTRREEKNESPGHTKESSNSNDGSGKKWDYNWDLKASLATKVMRERVIILIRHGQYDYKSGRLTDLGRKQAQQTGIRLLQMNLNLASISHSTLPRAAKTAEIINGCLNRTIPRPIPMISDHILIEGGPIQPEPTLSYWSLPERDYLVDGPRLESAFRKYFQRHNEEKEDGGGGDNKRNDKSTHEIIVAHGNIIRFFVLRSLQLPAEAWMRVFIAHASITKLSVKPDSTVSLTLFGDSGHLHYHDVTY